MEEEPDNIVIFMVFQGAFYIPVVSDVRARDWDVVAV